MITGSWNSCQIFDRPRNPENCSLNFGLTRCVRLYKSPSWQNSLHRLKDIYDNVSSEFTEYSRRMEAEQLHQQQRAAGNPEDRQDPNYQRRRMERRN